MPKAVLARLDVGEEVRVIGQVEDFGAKLERLALRDAEEARDASVEIVQPVAAQDVPPRVSERARGGWRTPRG